ncbi:MAG: CHAT domain-containing protein, partial [Cyanobacteria bacterium P01_C01_bin.38]
MTQEFHISVTPVGQNDYLVRTEQVAPGVPLAEELVRWPVADWLTAAGSLMNDPLQSVLQGDAMALSACLEETNARNSVNLVALGQQLYNALFQGTLRDSWITAQGIAQNHQQVLRLRLGLKDTKLARLPWEVMHQGDRPIATGPYIAFSRYQSGMSSTSRMPSRNIPQFSNEGGIKVLMVIASPADQVRLNLLKQEAIRLQAELERKTQGGDHLPEIELSVLEQPGREELTQALEQGNYHVLHYSGHSNFGANGGEIYLVSGRTGLTETLYGDDLAGLLVNNNIQMAVFNSCLGTYAATSDSNLDTGQRNLTETLVKRGIKSVLAMSERIPDEVALTLTQLFYRNLSQGYAVDLCVSRMRQGLISAYSSHQLYWALPILYLQPEFDGYLDPELYLPQSGELFNEYDPSSTVSTLYTSKSPSSDMVPMGGAVSPYPTSHSSDLDLLGEDMWGDLVDEIEYDDPSYSEDSAIVSDIFRQIDDEKGL